jgi:hypothetical protein
LGGRKENREEEHEKERERGREREKESVTQMGSQGWVSPGWVAI